MDGCVARTEGRTHDQDGPMTGPAFAREVASRLAVEIVTVRRWKKNALRALTMRIASTKDAHGQVND